MFFVTAYYKDEPAMKSSERLSFVSLPGAAARVHQIMSSKRELAGKFSVSITHELPDAVIPVVTMWEGGR